MPLSSRHAAAGPLPRPGDVVAGKYAIVSVIGEGGMGVVYEATHLRLRQRVALKMLLPEMLEHPIIVTRFEREALAAGQLRNRHAVRVMDVDVTAEGIPYMVMEFLEGHDLATELERRGRLPCDEAVTHVLQACSAMIEAHELGIVHRDLKPANLFLAAETETHDVRIVKVLDFGISKVQADGDAKITAIESIIGTPMYMSPEQLRASHSVDGRTDIWSLGIILYELLTGLPPWTGNTTQLAAAIVSDDLPDLRLQRPEVPAEVSAIIERALRRDPAERFADVRQLVLALAPFGRSGGDRAPSNFSSQGAPVVSIRPSEPGMEEARTLVQAAAVSQPRVNGGGTAPGWSQHEQPPARSRKVIVGLLAGVAIGLVVIGGLAREWGHRSARAIAAQAASHGPSAGAASATASAIAPVAPSPTLESSSPTEKQDTPPAPSASAAAVRPRAPVGRAGAPLVGAPSMNARSPAAVPPPAPAAPRSASSANPLTL